MKTKTFFNFNLFDGLHNSVKKFSWFKIDEQTGKIIAQGTTTPEKADQMIDLQQKYVMPGLINVHTHISGDSDSFDGNFNRSEAEIAVDAYQNLQTLLKSGVTYIRECGCAYDIDIKLKKSQKAGRLNKIPNMITSGRAISMTGGHGDGPHVSYLADSPDEVRKATRTAFRNGADCIKVMATGGVMSPGDFMNDPQLSIEEMQAAVIEAHHKRKTVAAHAEGNPGIKYAILAGVDSIEHGFYVNDEDIDLMLGRGTYLTPTLLAETLIPEHGKNVLPDWELKKAADALEDTYKNLSVAYKRGIKFTCGTDAGSPFNSYDKTPFEFELLTRLGMTPFEAYQCSTINSAKLCQIEDEYGTLEKGKIADFIVLDSNPLTNIKAVQQQDKQVFQRGVRQF
ncbi:amidohydrolase family protein [Lactobacillus sp. UCMA15818]|uniref:metal-dependent hydrolase family protein n=1 Tax=Lactobacillus sp. UCMA15818 TaxID=2583394 RepID=UPI0025B1E052|nr:amidohydrolase family protein [Lactobacillus sp. UCMA15818]MDN2452219.1 amidohydrolase family protein [Lactobacillus sp. UCMA15818]